MLEIDNLRVLVQSYGKLNGLGCSIKLNISEFGSCDYPLNHGLALAVCYVNYKVLILCGP